MGGGGAGAARCHSVPLGWVGVELINQDQGLVVVAVVVVVVVEFS